MKRIAEIRARRERAFYKNRMSGNKERELAAAKKLIEAENKYNQFATKDVLNESELQQVDAMDISDEEMVQEEDEEVVTEEPMKAVEKASEAPIMLTQKNKKRQPKATLKV